MKVAILLKSSPSSVKAERALTVTANMMSQGHTVNLYLFQEAVRLAGPGIENTASGELKRLVGQGLNAGVLTQDATVRGMDVKSFIPEIQGGTYETLVELMESCDRVIGLL